jgi:hypothetical protein
LRCRKIILADVEVAKFSTADHGDLDRHQDRPSPPARRFTIGASRSVRGCTTLAETKHHGPPYGLGCFSFFFDRRAVSMLIEEPGASRTRRSGRRVPWARRVTERKLSDHAAIRTIGAPT